MLAVKTHSVGETPTDGQSIQQQHCRYGHELSQWPEQDVGSSCLRSEQALDDRVVFNKAGHRHSFVS